MDLGDFTGQRMADMDLQVKKSHVSTKVDLVGFPFTITIF
jgi:hypothetical protein